MSKETETGILRNSAEAMDAYCKAFVIEVMMTALSQIDCRQAAEKAHAWDLETTYPVGCCEEQCRAHLAIYFKSTILRLAPKIQELLQEEL